MPRLPSTLSEPELAHRKVAWEALSNLFLDTDTTSLEAYIVRQLIAVPYSITELEEILVTEVTPVCLWNAFWWEWAGFDPDWLAERIQRKARSPFRLCYVIWFPYFRWKLRLSSQWHRIVQGVKEKRGATPST